MIDWLGIGHLFELSGMEAIAGFLTPLVVFAVFLVAHLVLPAIRVPGYVINPETGEPRNYRLNGILVYAIAVVVWYSEITGTERDWFYRYGWMYILPMWGMAVHPDPGFSSAFTNVFLAAMVALFLFGWGISRSGNLQKYWFKRWPDRKFLGIIEQRYIEVGDRKILYSGMWGVARHFNYMGEGFLALSVALVFLHPANLWAWTYMIFIVSLFTWRQFDDDKVCEEKYGAEKWGEYKARVKYRLFPGVF